MTDVVMFAFSCCCSCPICSYLQVGLSVEDYERPLQGKRNNPSDLFFFDNHTVSQSTTGPGSDEEEHHRRCGTC